MILKKFMQLIKQAVNTKDRPTVILAKTVKGYGLGEAGEGKNITHSQKKLNEDELKEFRSRFGIPISDEDVVNAPFYRPEEDSPEITYLKKRRQELNGYVPKRILRNQKLKTPSEELFKEFYEGTEGREASTTMVYVRILTKLLKDKEIGKRIVPIVPDEARTFGMEALFRQVGIYSTNGQLYEPVDRDSLLYYKEAKNGQILEEGITEAGSMSSFIAAGTAYITHGINMIPFFTFYSMFGFQRIGDLAWAAADMQCKGFLNWWYCRTELHWLVKVFSIKMDKAMFLAHSIPNVKAYDPAFAYELAVIIRDGIYRMYELQEDCYYYITVMNENYECLQCQKVLKMALLKECINIKAQIVNLKLKAHLLGSGSILNETLKAQEILEKDYDVSADVWSVTSYKNLHYDALEIERWNRMNPDKKQKKAYVQEVTDGEEGIFISASDYSQILSDSISKWLPGKLTTLGTLGFGRSESREALRDFFEVDAKHIVYTTLYCTL